MLSYLVEVEDQIYVRISSLSLLYVCEQHTMYTQASLRIYTGSHADKVSTKLSCVGLNTMHIAVHIVISP